MQVLSGDARGGANLVQQEAYERLVSERWQALQETVASAAKRSGRSPDAVRIIGVSKYVDVAQAAVLARVGISDLGENRWQVAKPKIEAQLPVRFHFIGPLQTNKVRKVAQHFYCVHTVDRLELVESLAAAAKAEGRSLSVLIQVNVAQDPTKSGVSVQAAQALVEATAALPQLQLKGLMMIGTQGASSLQARREFSGLRVLRDELETQTGLSLPELSMGMSNDFLDAIEEGATIVRIGRRLVLENC